MSAPTTSTCTRCGKVTRPDDVRTCTPLSPEELLALRMVRDAWGEIVIAADMVDSLERRGLVRRNDDTTDTYEGRPVVYVALTDSAREVLRVPR